MSNISTVNDIWTFSFNAKIDKIEQEKAYWVIAVLSLVKFEEVSEMLDIYKMKKLKMIKRFYIFKAK